MNRTKGILGLALALVFTGTAWSQAPAPKPGDDTAQAAIKTYRLTYTITELDGTKRIGLQHFSMTTDSGGRDASLKLGSKIPVITGEYSNGAAATGVSTQFTYLDVGMNIKSRVTELANGIEVSSKVEQSSVSDEKPNQSVMSNQPIIRQTVLENTALLTLGKPVMLGSLDIPASTHHYDIELALELVH
jgi:hypothetical protein